MTPLGWVAWRWTGSQFEPHTSRETSFALIPDFVVAVYEVFAERTPMGLAQRARVHYGADWIWLRPDGEFDHGGLASMRAAPVGSVAKAGFEVAGGRWETFRSQTVHGTEHREPAAWA